MSTRPTDFRLPGAIDLSALKRPPAPPPNAAGAGAAPTSGRQVVDVTEETFEAEVVHRSQQVPVLIDFWAEWCGPCKQLSPVLEQLAAADGGRWVLAKIDVDAEPRVAQAFQIQSIPTVIAVIGGQPVPLFQGAVSAAQAREVVDEVLKVAAASGISGTVAADGTNDADGDAAVSSVEAELARAQAALDRGDVDGALAGYAAVLERSPSEPRAVAGTARGELHRRLQGTDEPAARARAAAAADDIDAQLTVADLDLASGSVDEVVARLVELVRTSAGDDRNLVREHLLSLFATLDPDDPRLAAGRRALANALF